MKNIVNKFNDIICKMNSAEAHEVVLNEGYWETSRG